MKFKNSLLQNHWADRKQIWHKAFFGGGDSSLFKSGTIQFSKKSNNLVFSPNQHYDIILCVY